MAIFDTNLDYTQLIQFTNGSIQLASFVQIRNALIERMKQIYGNDIDVSPASADGQYINSIALLINNTFQTIKQGYDSLDPAVATGQYLDTLCSYNNIQRIGKTASVCQLYIYNSTASPIMVNKLTFVDKNNTLWMWDNGGEYITLEPGNGKNPYLILDVECQEMGEISAPGASAFYYFDENGNLVKAEDDDPSEQDWEESSLYNNTNINGTIYQCVDNNGIWVWQYQDAEVGTDEETDDELRNRRYLMMGNNSVTLLEGLKGALLNVTGVKDVFIFNNPSGNNFILNEANGAEPFADGTETIGHSIYIATRYKEGVQIDPNDLGSIIYNKLTPGIFTNPMSQNVLGEQGELEIIRTNVIKENIYWKICKSISPKIILNFYTNNDYDFPIDSNNQVLNTNHLPTSSTEKAIVSKLQSLIKEAKIDDYLTITDLLSIMQQADPQKQGLNTFFVSNGNIDGEYRYPANLNYFKYFDEEFLFSYDVANKTGQLIIGYAFTIPEASNDIITIQHQDEMSINLNISPTPVDIDYDDIEFISTDPDLLSVIKTSETTADIESANETGSCYLIVKYKGEFKYQCRIDIV